MPSRRGNSLYFEKEGRTWKYCPQCDQAYPFNLVYYGKNPRQTNGLNHSCKRCEARRDREYKKKLKAGYIPPEAKRNCQNRNKRKKETRDALKEEMKDLEKKVRGKKKKPREIGEDDLFYGLM